jgi:hypothetical protein
MGYKHFTFQICIKYYIAFTGTEHQVSMMAASSRGKLAFHGNASVLKAAKAAVNVVLSFRNVRLLRLYQMC